MENKISERMAPLNPSAIREIFKFAGLPGMISFAGGNPSEKTFPAAELAEVSARLFRDAPGTILQSGITEGYAPLRELTKARMRNSASAPRTTMCSSPPAASRRWTWRSNASPTRATESW